MCRVTVSRGVCERGSRPRVRELGACTCPQMRRLRARPVPCAAAVLYPAALATEALGDRAHGWARHRPVVCPGRDRQCDRAGAVYMSRPRCWWDPPCRHVLSRGAPSRAAPCRATAPCHRDHVPPTGFNGGPVPLPWPRPLPQPMGERGARPAHARAPRPYINGHCGSPSASPPASFARRRLPLAPLPPLPPLPP